MKKEIIINAAINEVRVAITEDGKLSEYYIELPDKEKSIGNIYLGRVNKIVSGINAAFIDIGLNQDAFLHFSDVDDGNDKNLFFEEEDAESNNKPKKAKATKKSTSNKLVKFHTKKSGEVTINLEPWQLILVQVIREAYHSKGMKVTTKLGIPGRYTVLLPFDNVLGVSKKIPSYVERRRLRQLAKSILPEGYGGIIRTAAQGKSEEELRRDWNYLLDIWKIVHEKAENLKKPGLVYQDLGLATSVVRDLFDQNVKLLAVDSKKLHKEIISYLKVNSPHIIEKVELYTGDKPIFEAFGIEKELAKTFKRSVPLPSGGDIVFDHTEAMHVIDVNSGRSNEPDQEKNAFKTNLEAAQEIVRQIRLRDLSGMIIIDFIDMQIEQNRKKLYQEVTKLLSKDRAKTVCYPLTQLGLMQITRQRINQNIEEKTSEICHVCKGTGRIMSKSVLINAIEHWLKNFRKNSREFKLILQLHPHIATYITEGTFSIISKLMLRYFVKITVQQSDSVPIDKFRFVSVRKDKDITNEYL